MAKTLLILPSNTKGVVTMSEAIETIRAGFLDGVNSRRSTHREEGYTFPQG